MSDDRGPKNGGRTMAVGVGVIAVAGLATLLAILFKGGGTGTGGTGPGAGSGTGTGLTPTTQSLISTTNLQRPLKVTIRENDYLVNGRPVDLATLSDLASKVPAGSGAAVMVERAPSSRAKAENDLKAELTKKGVSFTTD